MRHSAGSGAARIDEAFESLQSEAVQDEEGERPGVLLAAGAECDGRYEGSGGGFVRCRYGATAEIPCWSGLEAAVVQRSCAATLICAAATLPAGTGVSAQSVAQDAAQTLRQLADDAEKQSALRLEDLERRSP